MKKIIIFVFIVILFTAGYFYNKKIQTDFGTTTSIDMAGKSEVVVEMTGFAFVPEKITVNKGTKIIWINKDSVGHSIKSDPHPEHSLFPEMNSSDLSLDQSYSFIFEKEGVYSYHCDPHPRIMKGEIIVK